jgi:Fur family transcriptional regulator, ferric uptake regulator
MAPNATTPDARSTRHDDVHEVVDEQLRRSRQRYTIGRRQLVELLLSLGRPVTIPELLTSGASQSQSSLYRNLAILEQCGAVHRIASTDDVARYELTEELSEHHHHVVCSMCGRIDDVVLPPSIERALGEAAEQAREQRDYLVDSHRLELVGTCATCS